jgi:A/G-specific adenine glycosylase
MSPSLPIVLNDDAVLQIQKRIRRWGRMHFQDYPWRGRVDAYAGLIAEVLLQRTRASAVPAVFEKFLSRFPTPEHLARATEQEIAEVIYPLGLSWRVPLIATLGKRLAVMEKIPRKYDELCALPGVGPYTAAAWLSFHGDRRGVLIDSNIVRWICRLVGRVDCDGETRRKKWLHEMANRLTPKRGVKAFNYALLDFTMTVCVPGKPRCEVCPLGASLCAVGNTRLGGEES